MATTNQTDSKQLIHSKIEKGSTKLSLVIPAYNEESELLKNQNKIFSFLKKIKLPCEIILVDDGSIDNTANILKSNSKDISVNVIRNIKNKGKGYSVKKGIAFSKGTYILVTDADLSTPLDTFFQWNTFFDQGYDIIIGSRGLDNSIIIKKQALIRRFSGNMFKYFVQFMLLNDFRDTQCGFKCFVGEKIKPLIPLSKINGWSFDVELLIIAKKNKLKIKETHVEWKDGKQSKLKIHKDLFKILIELLYIKFKTISNKSYLNKTPKI